MGSTAVAVRIAYDHVGQGDPAVVFLHGLFEDRTYYAEQVAHLSRTHRVLNIDLRGHGESEVPDAPYSLDALACDVAAVCARAGVRRAVLCGHSMALALRVATRQPQLAAGVVLLDGAVLLRNPALEGLRQLVAALDTDGWREALLGFFGRVAGPAEERVRAGISAAPRVYAAPIIAEIASSSGTVHAHELAELRCPLLYMHGAMPSDLDRPRVVQPDAIVEEIPDAGHYLMLTASGRVNAALDRFLEVIR
jgi:pimeloyl-ACP methyl ester carboxylesterase